MPSSTPDLIIRRATLDDAAGMVALLNPIIEARIYTAMDTPLTLESQREWIESFPERGVFLVALEALEATGDGAEGRLVGMQDVTPFLEVGRAFDHVGVMGTFVALDCHRRGIAARLFEAMYAAARDVGYEKIFTFIRADNEAGLRAYRGQGFEVIGTAKRHVKIDGRYIDEIMVERFI
jgi:L-amino acid N-acyltransferase YncA